MRNYHNYLGLDFLAGDLNTISNNILEDVQLQGHAYHLVNAYTLSKANSSFELTKILEVDELISDGKPLTYFLKRRFPNINQIRGADLMRHLISIRNVSNSHFFLGSTPVVLNKLKVAAGELNPSIQIAGCYSPPFEDFNIFTVLKWVEIIQKSQANIVWVGLGTPKQDFVANEIAKLLPIKVIAIGAAFDYLAGSTKEAPRIFQIIWIEWLYRLLIEPKRLAKRYLIGNVKFIGIILRRELKYSKSSRSH